MRFHQRPSTTSPAALSKENPNEALSDVSNATSSAWFIISSTRPRNLPKSPGDKYRSLNPAAETFKSEHLNWITFLNRRAATIEVISYIHHFNTKRLHQTLGYVTRTEKLTGLTLAV